MLFSLEADGISDKCPLRTSSYKFSADAAALRPLGGRKCAWGPSYWCKTPFHARQCGTTRHCEENVWGPEEERRWRK